VKDISVEPNARETWTLDNNRRISINIRKLDSIFFSVIISCHDFSSWKRMGILKDLLQAQEGKSARDLKAVFFLNLCFGEN